MPTVVSPHLNIIDATVKAYTDNVPVFEADANVLQTRLLANQELKKLVHSIKWRAKDPAHLRDKLLRRADEADRAELPFDITPDNFVDHIHDLAGVRLLHFHMQQMDTIHPLLMQVFEEEGYVISEPPEAKTWDLEYEQRLAGLGLIVKRDESLYTSIHYVVRQNSRNRRHCELQVRTLAEELWGEVSHTINYPHKTDSIACSEQLKALARFVSGCSRLVDSIVASHEEHKKRIIATMTVTETVTVEMPPDPPRSG